jgi:hypothetical protein
MKSPSLLATAALLLCSGLIPVGSARADTVLYNSTAFMEPKADAFTITSPGTLTITLSNVPWADTIVDLNLFLTSTTGAVGPSMGAGTETIQVAPGTIYAHWFGDANGSTGIGFFGLNITFRPEATTVPLPGSLALMLPGLGMMLAWRRRPGVVPIPA